MATSDGADGEEHSYADPRSIHALTLFKDVKARGAFLHVSAPMVRYSKLPFRQLLQAYSVHLTYTPMILAHEFIRHPQARDSDFTTHATEPPLIAQFASNTPTEFARAALLIAPWVNGVDLNCGCPQSWAIKENIGCSLMTQPDLVRDMVNAASDALKSHNLSKSVSIKIRIHKDIATTIDFLNTVLDYDPERPDPNRRLDYVTVHARTRTQRSSTPPDLVALAALKRCFPDLPLIANGDVFSLSDAEDIVTKTGVQGVMAARGILENPALFTGVKHTPHEAVRVFLGYACKSGMRFELVVHHVSEMSGGFTTKRERRGLVGARDLIDIIDWVDEVFPETETGMATKINNKEEAGISASEEAEVVWEVLPAR